MMMKIEKIWSELEANSGDKPLVMRGYGSEGHGEIYVTWNNGNKERGIAVHMSVANQSIFKNRRELQDISLSLHIPPRQSKNFYLLIELKNIDLKEIFTTLAEDLIHSVANISEENRLVQALLNRLVQWEILFSRVGVQGLTQEAQRGLYGELWVLRRLLEAGLMPSHVIEAWVGPLAAVQDFQRDKLAIEVKTTSGNDHQKLSISSNRQLDDTNLSSLYLYHLSLDKRQGNKDTLNALVNSIKEILGSDSSALQLFNKNLLIGGYNKIHEPHYEDIGYTLRSEAIFLVTDGFPRIIESSTPVGVGDVKYSIIAGDCSKWTVNWQTLISDFKS